ncbi:MAG: 30S ribosomal protein S8 [Bdellovibrionales bacterium]|nr:30S ribosomal protein S8 [Bdellovibrionales bacterium]
MFTDPVADLLTRIRNANMMDLDVVEAPASRIKANIAKVLKDEGYIKNFRLVRVDSKHNLRIYLKAEPGKKAIVGIRRESKPGLRKYLGVDQIPRILNGAGTVILSTPRGVITGREAKKLRVGGEWLCSVW